MSVNVSEESVDAVYGTPTAGSGNKGDGRSEREAEELEASRPEPDIGASPELVGPVTRSGRKRKNLAPVKSSGKKKNKMIPKSPPEPSRPEASLPLAGQPPVLRQSALAPSAAADMSDPSLLPA